MPDYGISNPIDRPSGGGSAGSSGGSSSGGSAGSSTGPSAYEQAVRGLSGPEQVNSFHESADTDRDTGAAHHTLGPSPTQASPGNHTHDGRMSKLLPVASMPVGYSYRNLSLSTRPKRAFATAATATGIAAVPVMLLSTSSTPIVIPSNASDFEVFAQFNRALSTVGGDFGEVALEYSVNLGAAWTLIASQRMEFAVAGVGRLGMTIGGYLLSPPADDYIFRATMVRVAGTGTISVAGPIYLWAKEMI